PPMSNPSVFQVSFKVQFQNRGDVTITITRGGGSLSQTLSGIASGNYAVTFNLGSVPATDEIVLINGAAVENGVTFTASATSRITAPIVMAPGIKPTDSVDSALARDTPNGPLTFLQSGSPPTDLARPP